MFLFFLCRATRKLLNTEKFFAENLDLSDFNKFQWTALHFKEFFESAVFDELPLPDKVKLLLLV
jgi:hypothetical protein